MALVKDGVPANLSVPDYWELPKGTLRQLIRLSGLTRDEFIELLSR